MANQSVIDTELKTAEQKTREELVQKAVDAALNKAGINPAQVPTTWDDVKLIDGYPGKYIVLARRHGQQWYVAAINATKEPLKLDLQLPMLADKEVNFYSDAKDLEPQMKVQVLKKGRAKITLQPNGGAVWVQTSK